MTWEVPATRAHRLAASAGPLTFVGGAGDFDADGVIRNPGDLDAQLAGAFENVVKALANESCGSADIVRLKAFYTSDGGVDEWQLRAALGNAIGATPVPVMTLNPVPLQPWPAQEVQLQAIAQRGWRELDDVRTVMRPVPDAHASEFGTPLITDGLRAGEFYAVASQTAAGPDGETIEASGGIEQTHAVMGRLGEIQAELGASFQDAIKKEGYYFGTTMEEWAAMASIRATYFREPAAVATVVPCHALWPDGALTKVEVVGMRELWNGFDKYIPREDRWPKRVWDWPIPVPYRQGIRLRDMIWTGGQVPWEPNANTGRAMHPGDVIAQARFVMSFIEDILRAFDATTGDLRLLVCYFASGGATEETHRFVEAVDDCVAGPLPPITVVPQPHLHSDDTRVEIWGVADATRA